VNAPALRVLLNQQHGCIYLSIVGSLVGGRKKRVAKAIMVNSDTEVEPISFFVNTD
jgi:hypothetical protein